MDTRLLHTLLVLARAGSFTAAAAELHLVQSTVTSQVKALERQLGARLLDRLPNGARLTEAGQRAVDHAREVLAAQQRLLDAVSERDAVAGDVRIGAPESMCAYRLPQRLADVAVRWPDVTLHLAAMGTPAAVAGVRTGELDVALVLEYATVASDLDVEAIATEPVEVVAAPGSTVDDRYFLLEEGCSYSDRFRRTLPTTSAVTRFGSTEAVRSCVLAGLGRGVLPRVAVAHQLATGALRRVGQLPDSTLFLVTNPRLTPTTAARTITAAIRRAGTGDGVGTPADWSG